MITTKILAKLIKLISPPEVSPNYLELVPELSWWGCWSQCYVDQICDDGDDDGDDGDVFYNGTSATRAQPASV